MSTSTRFDLARLGLSHGEGRRVTVPAGFEPLRFGGETYAATADEVEATLDVSRTARGYAVRLRFSADVAGPCMRCLEPVTLRFDVEAREVDETHPEAEELNSPYVAEDELRLGEWIRDELALEVPTRFLCRPDGEGRCPACGKRVDGGAGEGGAEPDPRWAKLREIDLG